MAPNAVDHALSFIRQSILNTDIEEAYLSVVTDLSLSRAYESLCSDLSPAVDRDELRWVIAEAFLAGRSSTNGY